MLYKRLLSKISEKGPRGKIEGTGLKGLDNI